MNTLHRTQLPVPEDVLRADLAEYHQALADHALTVGVPAPIPQYDLLRVLDSEFVVEDDPAPPPLTPEEIFAAKVAEYEFAVRVYLDEGARAAQYDNILSARSYAGYPNKYQAESISFVVWSAEVWDAATATLNAVMAGALIPPLDEFLASLPVRTPPA